QFFKMGGRVMDKVFVAQRQGIAGHAPLGRNGKESGRASAGGIVHEGGAGGHGAVDVALASAFSFQPARGWVSKAKMQDGDQGIQRMPGQGQDAKVVLAKLSQQPVRPVPVELEYGPVG